MRRSTPPRRQTILRLPMRCKLVTAALVAGFLFLNGCASLCGRAAAREKPVRVERGIVYREVDGQRLLMDVYRPTAGRAPFPAVLHVHGGGWVSGARSTGSGASDLEALARRGYLVASVDYRLAPRCLFPAALEDVRAAIRFLRGNAGRFDLDPSRIGALGTSAGGHLVSLIATCPRNSALDRDCHYAGQPDALQAVVAYFPPTDLPALFRGVRRAAVREIFGTGDLFSPLLEDASPISHVSREAPPFLIVQGDRDSLVPPDQSRRFYELLSSAGAEAELLIVENAGHAFDPAGGPLRPGRAEIRERMIGFFDEWL